MSPWCGCRAIANFDDVEPLAREFGVRVRYVRAAAELRGADLVVVPGSKRTAGRAARPFTVLTRRGQDVGEPEGAMSADGAVVGTYLHGIFASPELRRRLLRALADRRGITPDPRWGTPEPPGARYDRLADAVAPALDLAALAKLVRR